MKMFTCRVRVMMNSCLWQEVFLTYTINSWLNEIEKYDITAYEWNLKINIVIYSKRLLCLQAMHTYVCTTMRWWLSKKNIETETKSIETKQFIYICIYNICLNMCVPKSLNEFKFHSNKCGYVTMVAPIVPTITITKAAMLRYKFKKKLI